MRRPLRDRDIHTAETEESLEDKDRKPVERIRSHYHKVLGFAEQTRAALGVIPLVVMGHLFAAEGKTVEGDGVRELYVGSLAHVGADLFPPGIDYLALERLRGDWPKIIRSFWNYAANSSRKPMKWWSCRRNFRSRKSP